MFTSCGDPRENPALAKFDRFSSFIELLQNGKTSVPVSRSCSTFEIILPISNHNPIVIHTVHNRWYMARNFNRISSINEFKLYEQLSWPLWKCEIILSKSSG